MADFQVIRRKSKSAPAEQDLTQDDQSSLLSKAGAGAMSGLHTVGSILSWPSRLVHGAINAAVGGKEGFGENYFNPFDSRGGVEGSRHLINAGILAENNPNEWEWGDLGRGVADLALDPTTYMGPGLTKIGRAAEKGGTLAAGRIAQTANKQRALLNVGLPFADPIVSIGTGAGTAKALQDIGKYSGLTRATKAVKESFPARAMGALFDARKQGLMHKTAQQEAMKATDELRKLQTASRGDINRAIRTDDLAKMHQDDLRMGLEGAEKSAVQGGYVPHPSAADDALEPHVMLHINPQGKINEHFADAAHNGLLDDAIRAGQPINAPLMHLDETGKPVLGKGAVNLKSNKIKDLAKQAFDEEMAALAKKTEGLPMWADDAAEQAAKNAPFSVTDTLHSHFPGSLNTETVAFRDIMKATGKTPAEIVEALNKEIPGGYSLQRHDLPSQIIDEGRQAEHFWSPKDPGDIGSHDKAFVGFSLRPETGKAIADAKAAVSQTPPVPSTSAMPDLDAFLASKKNPGDWRKMLEENTDKMIGQGKFHRFSAADFMNDPTHGPMNKAYIDLLKSKGYDIANLKHNGSDSISGDLVKIASPTPHTAPLNTPQPTPAGFADDLAKKESVVSQAGNVAPAAGQKPTIHPERQKIIDESKALEKNRSARLQEHAARIAKELQDASTPDEAIATLAKMRDLKEPNMAVMVPQSQAEQIRRQFAGGERTRNVSENTKRVRASKEYEHLTTADKEMLDRQRRTGFGMGEELHDPTIEHFPRRESVTAAKQETGDVAQRGTAVMPANLPEDAKRKWFLTGNHEGTIGVNKILKDPVLHDAAAEGVDAVEAALRQRHGHLINGLYQDPKQRAAVARTLKAKNTIESRIVANKQKISDMMSNSALQAARQSTDPATIKEVAKYDRKIAKTQAKIDKYKELHQQVAAAHEEALHAGHDRIPALAKYIVDNPDMKGVDKFGNHPFADYATARQNSDRKYAMTKAFHSIVSKELNKGDGLVTVGQLLKDKGFKIRTAAEQIAGREFENAADLKAFLNENTIDSKLAAELKAIAPSYKAPAAANEVADKFKSGMAWWKGLTLAFPASRVRDAIGGVVQNVLHGWAKPSFLTEDARLLLTGKIVKRDYSHVPEIKEWLAKTGKEWSPENQTEALRQLIATYLPSDHNILADVPTGQVGAGLDQLAHNIPGTQQTTMFNQFLGDPLRALAGKDPGGATWLGTAQPGETMLGKVARAAKQITNVRGVGDAAETMLAPVKASEIVAANSDAYNRAAPFMQQIHGGTKAEVAANKVNRAQIDYSPDTFTATERGIKNYIAPFYSFNSRVLPETARQLSDFGSPTSQLIKTIDRAHGGGDASVPDYVMSGTGIPLGTRSDGSKSYLTGLGQMYEPAVSQLGLLAGGITDPRSLRAAGFDTLAQLNPMLGTPLQRITGQSFFQRGEPISNMDPIAGRLMSNIGESLGLRSPDEGPVKFPGSGYVDTVLGATPFGRAAAQVRTLADPRKDIASKMVDTLSGARVTDISPEKQMATLQKRAEDLARSQGAWEQRTVGFPKEQLAKLAMTNPELAAEQQHLQNMITMMKRKRTIHRKQKKAAEKK